MPDEFLLEIGTEEIPSGYLRPGLNDLKQLFEKALEENRIGSSGKVRVFGTPRRLVLAAPEIADRQEDLVEEISGPPAGVAFDEEGKPTRAAVGFAEKQGVPVNKLAVRDTPKGQYVYVKKKTAGRPTAEVLVDFLPGVIAGIPWPKSMRWGSGNFSFVRPVHWVVAIHKGNVVPFEIAGLISGDSTRGHRFLKPESIKVSGIDDYLIRIKDAFVIIDPEERDSLIDKLVKEAACEKGGLPGADPELVTTVADLVEYPSAVCGEFEKRFLDLPDPVLITAMREHQKYFAVYDAEGGLSPRFVAVNNTKAQDESIVCRGHERVLRARLSDADFFFKEDRCKPLGDRLGDLKGVIYQADLGTSYAKVRRFSKLGEYLCGLVRPERLAAVRSAAWLCKCDLVTHMVMEFPGLQGVMGMEYARIEGYDEEICRAVYEHYLPLKSGGQLPESEIGAIVGCADRMDTICGCFAVGLAPSGSADPFALRRHALAIIRILESRHWDVSLGDFIGESLSILAEDLEFHKDKIYADVIDFMRERYKQMMLRSGYGQDLIEAVLGADFDHLDLLRGKMDHLGRFINETKDFESLAVAFKRVNNILKGQKEEPRVDRALFLEPCEAALWDTYEGIKERVDVLIASGDYYEALNLMAHLREPVDDFFDGVEVLTKDAPELKRNRVAVLLNISYLLGRVADFGKFSM